MLLCTAEEPREVTLRYAPPKPTSMAIGHTFKSLLKSFPTLWKHPLGSWCFRSQSTASCT